MTIKKPYDPSSPSRLFSEKPSMTKQSFKRECDINHLLRQYRKTGLLNHVNTYKGEYEDLSETPDYHTSMNKILAAQNCFNSLPALLRKRFDNDPGKFLEFTMNPDNLTEMQALGLAKPSPESAVTEASTGTADDGETPQA